MADNHDNEISVLVSNAQNDIKNQIENTMEYDPYCVRYRVEHIKKR